MFLRDGSWSSLRLTKYWRTVASKEPSKRDWMKKTLPRRWTNGNGTECIGRNKQLLKIISHRNQISWKIIYLIERKLTVSISSFKSVRPCNTRADSKKEDGEKKFFYFSRLIWGSWNHLVYKVWILESPSVESMRFKIMIFSVNRDVQDLIRSFLRCHGSSHGPWSWLVCYQYTQVSWKHSLFAPILSLFGWLTFSLPPGSVSFHRNLTLQARSSWSWLAWSWKVLFRWNQSHHSDSSCPPKQPQCGILRRRLRDVPALWAIFAPRNRFVYLRLSRIWETLQ